MAANANPTGFYGAIGNGLELRCASLFRNVHRQAMSVPQHEHRRPYFAVLLRGNYREPGMKDEVYFTPFTVGYQPEGACHRGKVEACGCDFFTIELEPDLLEEQGVTKKLAEPIFHTNGGQLLRLMLQIFSEYQGGGCEQTIGELLLELLGAAANGNEERFGPSLWRAMRDKAHDEFRQSVRVRELATVAGVHPVHAARVFRKYAGCTPSEYVRNLKAQAACRMIAADADSLSAVAAQCGFADQSHMTREFQRIYRSTPGDFQRRLRGEAALH